jgi:hypothetical protein
MELGCGDVVWIHLALYRDRWLAVVDTVITFLFYGRRGISLSAGKVSSSVEKLRSLELLLQLVPTAVYGTL